MFSYIQKLFYFCSVLSFAACDEDQLALQVPQLVQTVALLGEWLVSLFQLDTDDVMDAVSSFASHSPYNVTAVGEDVVHLTKGGDLD